MTVQCWDTVQYHGEICTVEAVWDTIDETHTPFCQLRPLEADGTYWVEQDAVRRYTPSHTQMSMGLTDLLEAA